ncbi:MAG: 4Fe-4S dicluster domain-containing protein [Bacteroidales bacterium]|nr:4Fe-4S dicluster domain-containing protein [Bacteroidales bacterium]
MEPLLKLDASACTSCFTCVRTCPVKAIHIKEGETIPFIVHQQCIGCGSCVTDCNSGAIAYRSSVDDAKALFNSGERTAVIVSPGISAEFHDISDYRKFVTMIRSLGATLVNEVSFAVDLIAYKYINLFNDFKGRYYITSNDPVVVAFITKYRPNLISNLTPVVSPMIAMTRIVRKIHGPDIRVVYVGPEIATKEEALQFDGGSRVDVVLTFQELRTLFIEYKIDESNLEYSDFDPPLSYKGSLYPLRNGLVQAGDIDENALTTNVLSVEGKMEMMEAINEFEKYISVIQRHFCITSGNALAGPGMTWHGNRQLKENQVINYVNKRLQNFFRIEWYNDLQRFMNLDLSREFVADDQRLPEPPTEKVREVLVQLGKNKEQYSGCQECGYASCLDLAKDIARGITIPQMCFSYTLRNKISFDESVRTLNEKLAQSRRALRDSQEKAKVVKESAIQASELTNAMLEKLRAGVVIVDNMLKIVKANSVFATILGEDALEIGEVIPGLVGADLKKLIPVGFINLFSYVMSENESIENRDIKIGEHLLNVSIFPIVKGKIAGGIIRDMRAPEVQRVEVINRIGEVIERNLGMVQKIGFLLGEGATDIERMLNSIIEFYKGEPKK